MVMRVLSFLEQEMEESVPESCCSDLFSRGYGDHRPLNVLATMQLPRLKFRKPLFFRFAPRGHLTE